MPFHSALGRLAAVALAFTAVGCQPKPALVNPEDPAIVAAIDSILRTLNWWGRTSRAKRPAH